MQRFFGMMPSSEIEKTKRFKDKQGLVITIDAGPHGWTITYADNSTKYKDVDSTTEENFKEARNILLQEFDFLVEVSDNNTVCCAREVVEG